MVSPNDSHVLDETVCTQIKGRTGLMGIDKGLDVGIESKEISPHLPLFSLRHATIALTLSYTHIQSVVAPVIISSF